jgi:hypothetical protein
VIVCSHVFVATSEGNIEPNAIPNVSYSF